MNAADNRVSLAPLRSLVPTGVAYDERMVGEGGVQRLNTQHNITEPDTEGSVPADGHRPTPDPPEDIQKS